MKIDKRHPRFFSLRLREKLVRGVSMGITSQAGLIAHGRGEAFDYLLGEKTHAFAETAIKAAASHLLLARKPVLSVNGNTAILCPGELITLASILGCKIEVNLFHFSSQRVKTIEAFLRKRDPARILDYEKSGKIEIPGIASMRAVTIREGIGNSDCVFIPLEDGDRCEALIALGKKVITCDLNPLSRTAKNATVSIIDNIARTMPLLISAVRKMQNEKPETLTGFIRKYDNRKILDEAQSKIRYDSKR